MKILVVDDEQLILDLAGRILRKQGYEVILADSGSSGLEQLNENSNEIDLVLLDIMMDDISGMEVLEQMRHIAPALPCILSSGYNTNEVTIPKNLQNHTCLLEKPYQASQLTKKVHDMLAAHVPDQTKI